MHLIINYFNLMKIASLYFGALVLVGAGIVYYVRRRRPLKKQTYLILALGPLLLLHFGVFSAEFLQGVFSGPQGTAVGWAHDDGYISMRYAYNLAHGNGLVFNPGERTEGFTNLGWVVVMAAAHVISSDLHLNLFLISLLNLGLNLVLIAMVFLYLARAAGPVIAVFGGGLLAIFPPMVTWGVGGMETPLQALLIFLALKPLLPQGGDGKGLTLPLLGLAYIVRPDSGLFLAVAGLWLIYAAVKGELKWGRLIIGIIAAATMIAGVFVFRYAYYGEFLPNTYYLKAPSGLANINRGILYLIENIQFILPAYILAALALLLKSDRLSYWRTASFVAVWLAYVIWLGGDGLGGGRFFIATMPLVCVLAALGVDALLERVSGLGGVLRAKEAGILSLLAALVFIITAFADGVAFPDNAVRHSRGMFKVLDYIRSNLQEGGTALSPRAGAIPYYCSDLPLVFYDPLGKVDRHIARTPHKRGSPGHSKWDIDYSLGELKPDLIIASDAVKAVLEGSKMKLREYDKALFENAIFRENYLPNRIDIEGAKAPLFYRTGTEKLVIR